MARLSAPPRGIFRTPHISTYGWLSALALVGIAGAALVSAHRGTAHADTGPSLAVTLQPSSAGNMAVYKVVATGFPAGAAITETIGDGTNIAPAAGHANDAGTMTIWWTLDATNKYCGTLTAKSDAASASVSFWVAVASDTQSGTTCAAPTSSGGGTATPATTPAGTTTADANATAAASATAAATQAAAPQPTTVPDDAGGTGAGGSTLGRLLGRVPWVLVALGGGGLLLVVILAFGLRGLGAGKPSARPRRAMPRRMPPNGRGVAGWADTPTRRGPAQGMGGMPPMGRGQAPMPGGPGTFAPQGWAPRPNQPEPYVPGRTADWRDAPRFGPGAATPGGRSGQHPAPRQPQPDIRWSRSHPSAERSRPGAPGSPGRTLRDAPSAGRRPNAPDSAWLQDQ